MTLSLLLRFYKKIILLISFLFVTISIANAQFQSINNEQRYSMKEIVASGHDFFGQTTGNIATAIEKVFSQYGQPNAYILGEEASGAFFAGLTYGEGEIFTKNDNKRKIFWQGPSLGWDFGGQGSRLMILIYDLNNINDLWGRYAGISGSAYLIAGAGFHVLKRNNILLIPIRTGIGARLGINMGYLKLTPMPTWNPF
ncbi:DUF1134 domain-containing protein [Bartonella bacilliformis]|uniref:DUF1134 domain-containing protein n=2 Tax=Bartonella bacilliformis TaxID=774 RepID=A1UTJ6_BARBK|nr:EipA family protein [Bartonella bacilliformis]ABM44766.1 conserved hypothetical protein [Bartonella bacilliformis KC583]AMG86060.1 DUF1134 domain-containing protein [Bartonella bacilliformis]KZM37668.1 hypothetical protein AWH67_03620 [Bartonella bacilliformis]KZN21620.1 hypothetical protein A6B38_04335 [Bartonella bacilliformis]QFZ90625.1 DUF1134 domain-containing protein [Bartonella bacilliformis]